MKQQSMHEFVERLDKINQIHRVKGPVRVDELPSMMEAVKDKALFVEKVKDHNFQFLAGAYSTRAQYADALECEIRELPSKLSEVSTRRHKPVIVDTAPCKEVILKGDDVDLTIFPLFLHHPYDGNAYIQDTNIISRNLETGLINWGMYRLMYRSKNETNIDMRNDSHNSRIIAKQYQGKNIDMPVAIVIGGPTLDKIASMTSAFGVDDWDILGGFYNEPAKLIKCETNELTFPANTEIVLEGRIITSEGWIYDEGPYGEATGTYGGGLPHNCRLVIDCITHRKNAIYQFATVGGLKPGSSDMAVMNLAMESDIMKALKNAGLNVLDVYMPPGSCMNAAYARIKTKGGGDAKQALCIMLSCSRQWFPKIAYVFDDDVDIFDDDRVKWAMAWRFNPQKGTIIIPEMNVLPPDPLALCDHPPVNLPKVGFDCTLPLVGNIDRFSFEAATVTDPFGEPLENLKKLTEKEIVKEMTEFIKEKPRTWKDILMHFHGQSNPLIYRAFGQIRPKLGRIADRRPEYPYTFADSWFVFEKENQ
jgi:UbiD family decarboxylase